MEINMNPINKQITLCCDRSGHNEPGSNGVLPYIDEYTTPETLDARIAGIAGYKLENGANNGWHALMAAARAGNSELVAHIVQKGGNRLVNLGNRFGMTPLMCTAFFVIIKKKRC